MSTRRSLIAENITTAIDGLEAARTTLESPTPDIWRAIIAINLSRNQIDSIVDELTSVSAQALNEVLDKVKND